MRNKNVLVFHSTDTDAFARAAAILKSENISFRSADTDSRGARVPMRMHHIYVRAKDADAAKQAISGIPSEIVISSQPEPISKSERVAAWIQFATLVMILLFGIIKMIWF